jgi:hypothetical protein
MMIQEKLNLKINLPTLLLMLSMFVGGTSYCISYVFSLDKRLSIMEQNIVHVEQDGEQRDRTLSRIEDKVDKIPEYIEQLMNLFKK